LIWEVKLTTTIASRLMNSVAHLLPDSWWQKRFMLRVMALAGRLDELQNAEKRGALNGYHITRLGYRPKAEGEAFHGSDCDDDLFPR
jgi:hypothetical protein